MFHGSVIIILTSNLGSNYLLEGIGSDGEITDQAKEQVEALLKQSFRPEFLNRLDEIVFYKPLSKENIRAIVELMLEDLNRRLVDKQLRCVLTEAAMDYVIDNGFDPVYGARPLKRFLQSHIETLIAKKIIAGDLLPESTLEVDIENQQLVVNVRQGLQKV